MSGTMVNKLTADIDKKNSNQDRTIIFYRYSGKQMKYRYLHSFIDVIYKNFEYLSSHIKTNHSRHSIENLLLSESSIIILGILDNSIVGYLIANSIDFKSQKLMHIYYLYTAPIHRGNGIATYMLNLIQKYAIELNIYILSLALDTHNKSLVKFYMDNHFDYDVRFRTFKRYDNFIKYI